MSDKPPADKQFAYFCSLQKITSIARELGYAVAVHGSVSRDFDVIACPWTQNAVSPEELADAVRLQLGGWFEEGYAVGGWKPHGRRAFIIYFGGSLILDLSVMPKGDDELMVEIEILKAEIISLKEAAAAKLKLQ